MLLINQYIEIAILPKKNVHFNNHTRYVANYERLSC